MCSSHGGILLAYGQTPQLSGVTRAPELHACCGRCCHGSIRREEGRAQSVPFSVNQRDSTGQSADARQFFLNAHLEVRWIILSHYPKARGLHLVTMLESSGITLSHYPNARGLNLVTMLQT
jgi:hypothetical protein